MAARDAAPEGRPRIADRLAAARRGRFVGRQDELALFRSALLAAEPPFVVLAIHGPGGVGKTTLLRAYEEIAAECDRSVVRLDGRDIEPSVPGFLRALRDATGLHGEAAVETATIWPTTPVVLIDTYETLAPLDTWLRETFLPELPDGTFVVIAGRNPPEPAWRTDLDWGDLLRVLPLGNLRPEESQTYLAARGIPADQHAAVRAFTHGHPLALALVAETVRQGGGLEAFDPQGAPDVVRALLERLVREVLSAEKRLALGVCALARSTTEAILAEALGVADAHALFAWLRGLSFIEQGPRGLFPHDLAREVLDNDLRWRDPAAREELRARLLVRVRATIARATGAERQRLGLDLLYLSRHEPSMRPYLDWAAPDSAAAVPATPADTSAILAMVRAHEGDAAARIAAHWLRVQPGAFLAFRRADDTLFGFMANLALHEATPDDLALDPAATAALDFARDHGDLGPGEEIVYLRFWMSGEAYQQVGPALNLIASTSAVYWATHPRMVWNFVAVADPDFMQAHFTGVRIWRTPGADFSVGGRCYGVFSHDWRAEPAPIWQRLLWQHASPGAPAAPVPPVALARAEFAGAVREALRDYTRPDRLATNPLLRALAGTDGTPATLQATLREAVAGLATNPRDIKFHRAVWHTYFEPAPTQERAAELLGLPFNTYRYHLAKGIGHVTEWLWRRTSRGADR